MKKLILIIISLFIISMNVTVTNAENIHGERVEITEENQVVDSITFNGITVNVYYSPHTPFGSDNVAYYRTTGLSCTEFVQRFLRTVYPGGYTLEPTKNPVPGDWVKYPTHDALVKEVYTDPSGRKWALLIEQNYWLSFGGRYALKGRRITIDEPSATFYHPIPNRPAVNADKVQDFVKRLYKLCLNRDADKTGLNYWTNLMVSGQSSAAEVAEGFFFSDEMKKLKLSNKDYIERCYLAMMKRSSDKGGLKYWNNILTNGASRKRIVKGFIDSKEFTNICDSYGVPKGSISLTEARDFNDGITAFVSRCYTKVLDRKAEVAGLNFWCNNIYISRSAKYEALNTAMSFFNSEEFVDKNVSDEEFIKICYRTFLDREAEAGGLKYWKEQISLIGKNFVLNGFASSQEFANILAKYGLKWYYEKS